MPQPAPPTECRVPRVRQAIKSAIVESISPTGTAPMADGKVKLKVQCVEDDDLDLDDGDHIVFAEVEGMSGLNHQEPLPVLDVSKGRKCFIIAVPPEAAAGEYTRGGLVTEKRMPKDLQYMSLADFATQPGELWETDESKMSPAATVCSRALPARAVLATAPQPHSRAGACYPCAVLLGGIPRRLRLAKSQHLLWSVGPLAPRLPCARCIRCQVWRTSPAG